MTAPGDVSGPLAGLLVADLSRVLAGPYATQMLGDLGADIIKVESPSGDETRGWLPPERDGISTYYLGINRNKRSVILDYGNQDDLALAKELCRRADVVIENHKPGGLTRFGLDYDSVKATNPSVVYASISGYGADGGASLPGYDLTIQAASGLMSLTGDPDGPGFRSGVSVMDITTGLHATIGILAALRHRDNTGEGQRVDVSLLMSAFSAMANHSSTYVASGHVPMRMGNGHPAIFPYDPFPCKDGEIIIAAANDGQFGKLCDVLGVPHLARDPRFASGETRNRNREALRPLLTEALAHGTRQEWFTRLSAVGVPCGPINTIGQGIEMATELGLDPVITVGEADRAVPMVRNPIGLSATPPTYRVPPPRLGEHSTDIKRWLASPTPDNAD
jgi:crotonobetainyl-CoA:carnitine CoA-transferase CaiB-like acyl-CoA transferase